MSTVYRLREKAADGRCILHDAVAVRAGRSMTIQDPNILVTACKFDGRKHRSWIARLVARHASYVRLNGRFEENVNHAILGCIEAGTYSDETFWMDKWYSIFRFTRPSGELQCYYCNINLPPTFDGQALTYIDLDVDIIVRPDWSYIVVDEDEFQSNAILFDYPASILAGVSTAVDDLQALIEQRNLSI